jgi:hypothetical protein
MRRSAFGLGSLRIAVAEKRAGAREWLLGRIWIVGWWAGSRLVVLGVALVVHSTNWPKRYFSVIVAHHTFGLLDTWDGQWYALIARRGYLLVPGSQSDPAFLPLYPMVLRGIHALGIPLDAAGVLISNLFFLVALFAFYELGRELFDERLSRRSTVLLALAPAGFVFSMAYPEALALAAVCFAALFALRGRWLLSGTCVAIAALARPEGVLIAIPIAALAHARWQSLDERERPRAVSAILAGPAALLSYPLYLSWAVHDPFAWSQAEAGWGRSFRVTGLPSAVLTFWRDAQRQPWLWRDLCFCLIYATFVVLAARARLPWAWLAMGAFMLVLPLMSGTFQSEYRFGLLALPAYWGLASVLNGARSERLAATLAALSLVAGTFTLTLAFP